MYVHSMNSQLISLQSNKKEFYRIFLDQGQ